MTTNNSQLRHGRITTPKTRGLVATDLGLIGEWENNEMEGGKNFPDLNAGPVPAPFQADNPSNIPPKDGLILSGGHAGNRESVNFTDQEMQQKLRALGKADDSFSWPKIAVKPGELFDVKWAYTAPHTTRGYRWFITKDGWNPQARITRDQLEVAPFSEDFYPFVPYYSHQAKLVAKTNHQVLLPTGKKGHHVIVLLWIVANSGNAFYQAFDVDFGA
ncbi:chitin-binding protein [Yersinia entomophaga]|uniref:Chitin-binding protein n=1 Tax=Yersinia entomophaga TaxID=935293 RepID=A0ABN4PPZ8_YERET|nr:MULTISPECIES: lytic polysaccharide monooxygenase auxiliary activity family 9 protein [Yersinia]ANI29258.1 chitin-binding protein [Yersinia entomophaga]OWF89140.1 chitin-binding protein [Yersinia entomophaga]